MTWPNYSPATRKAVNDLLKKGGSLSAYKANPQVGSGPTRDSWAWRLEREIESRFKVKHAVACNSGTGGLQTALVSTLAERRVTSGEIIVSPYTFSASAAAILLSGFTPVFADVDPYTFCITPETVKAVISKRTVAILPVSIFGGMADVHGLKAFGLPVIEDACQAVGARNQYGYSGTHALSACYSMNGGKNIPAGECGMAVTNDSKIAERMRLVMNHGENFGSKDVGFNFRPNELTACVAYHGLLELEERNERRQKLGRALVDAFHDLFFHVNDGGFWMVRSKQCGTISFPCYPNTDHVAYVYPFLLERNRDLFIKRMKRKGVTVGAGYISPTLHKYRAFRKYCAKSLPVVEELSSKTLCLLYDLTPDKPLSYAEKVAQAMRECLE